MKTSNEIPFREQMEELNKNFTQAIEEKYSKRTAEKHYQVIDLFIDFICWDMQVSRFEDITRGMANSYFRRWYISKIGDRTESELKTSIKKFFLYLHENEGLTSETVLKSFKRN
mgnify:CR=1 FL=1